MDLLRTVLALCGALLVCLCSVFHLHVEAPTRRLKNKKEALRLRTDMENLASERQDLQVAGASMREEVATLAESHTQERQRFETERTSLREEMITMKKAQRCRKSVA